MGSPLEISNDYRSHEEKNQEKEKYDFIDSIIIIFIYTGVYL